MKFNGIIVGYRLVQGCNQIEFEEANLRLPQGTVAPQQHPLLDMFDHLSCGAFLLAAGRRVVGTNRFARSHVNRGLVLVQDRLRAQVREQDAALERLIGDVLDGGTRGRAQAALVLPRGGQLPLLVQCLPLASQGGSPHCALLAIDPEQKRVPNISVLRQAFGLTASEARLALCIADGLDIAEIAAAHKIAESTARSQLKAVFAKTGTRRQAELSALLAQFRLF